LKGIFSCRRIQTDTAAHPASYSSGTGFSFSGDKAAAEWSWPLTSIYCWAERMCGDIPPLLQYIYGVMLSLKRHRDKFTLLCLLHIRKFIPRAASRKVKLKLSLCLNKRTVGVEV